MHYQNIKAINSRLRPPKNDQFPFKGKDSRTSPKLFDHEYFKALKLFFFVTDRPMNFEALTDGCLVTACRSFKTFCGVLLKKQIIYSFFCYFFILSFFLFIPSLSVAPTSFGLLNEMNV